MQRLLDARGQPLFTNSLTYPAKTDECLRFQFIISWKSSDDLVFSHLDDLDALVGWIPGAVELSAPPLHATAYLVNHLQYT